MAIVVVPRQREREKKREKVIIYNVVIMVWMYIIIIMWYHHVTIINCYFIFISVFFLDLSINIRSCLFILLLVVVGCWLLFFIFGSLILILILFHLIWFEDFCLEWNFNWLTIITMILGNCKKKNSYQQQQPTTRRRRRNKFWFNFNKRETK